MTQSEPRSQQTQGVLILGMHRSGTSVVARMVDLLGADLGPSLGPPAADNPTGHWESGNLRDLNERVLARLGRSWDSLRTWDPALEPLVGEAELLDEARRRVEAEFGASRLWAFKDPRLCLLLPFWTRALHETDQRVAHILCVRHPGEVAASLARRDGFPLAKSLRLWLGNNRAALRHLPGDFLVVSYQRVLDDPGREMARVARYLRRGPGDLDAAVQAFSEQFLDSALKHHDASGELEGGDRALALFSALRGWASEAGATTAEAAAELSAGSPEAQGAQAPCDLAFLLDRAAGRAEGLRATAGLGTDDPEGRRTLAAFAQELASVRQELLTAGDEPAPDEVGELLARGSRLLDAHLRSLARLEVDVALELRRRAEAAEEMAASFRAHEARLEAARDDAERRVAELRGSLSWRITAPLRGAYDRLTDRG